MSKPFGSLLLFNHPFSLHELVDNEDNSIGGQQADQIRLKTSIKTGNTFFLLNVADDREKAQLGLRAMVMHDGPGHYERVSYG